MFFVTFVCLFVCLNLAPISLVHEGLAWQAQLLRPEFHVWVNFHPFNVIKWFHLSLNFGLFNNRI